ncbi:DUF2000 domain-containing protein [Micromonospora deserti]|uniref:DUF2000 domain-containing protein n=1 Tax=Micromonospora deserti TaxID=2070366 RepID=A0A2W2EC30_9ACTN|nr:DUF2000 domain-containing protein [Micromonospora deserti]PZG02374.1 DUF2000 domain-containing protein [Micromonospora deserti]
MGLETKIVIVVRDGLAPNLATNAAAVLGLSLGGRLPHLLGADGKDASGGIHAGLNTHPVPILTADRHQIADLHTRARVRDDITAVGFTQIAQRARDYTTYLDDLAAAPDSDLEYLAVALHGPRNRIAALTKRLPLLG